MIKYTLLFAFLFTHDIEASSTSRQILEVEAASSRLVIKTPARQRRSPIEALSGITHTVVMQPQESRTIHITKPRHRSPLDALSGRSDNSRIVVTPHSYTTAKKIKRAVSHHKTVALKSAIKTKQKSSKLLAMVTPKHIKTSKTTAKIIKKSAIHIPRKNNNSGEKILYLTFDDGPLNGTQNVLDATREEGVDATMFFIGKHVQMNHSLFVKAASRANLLVANHTYSHADGQYRKFYNDKDRVLRDIDKSQRIIGGSKYLRLCGRNVWRLPDISRDDYGISRGQRNVEITDYNALEDKGYQIYGWDIEWGYDHSTKIPLWDAKEMAAKINAKYNSGYTARRGKMILLSHDFMFKGAEGKYELIDLISILKSQGWKFETLTSYTKETPGVFVKLKKLKEPKKIAKKIVPTVVSFPKEQIRVGSLNATKQPHLSIHELELTTKLNDAITSYNPVLVRKLIRQGASLNSIDQSGQLALNTAVRVNNMTIVKILIKHGAKINNRDLKGASPILIAQRYHRLKIGSYLINQLNIQKNDATIALAQKASMGKQK